MIYYAPPSSNTIWRRTDLGEHNARASCSAFLSLEPIPAPLVVMFRVLVVTTAIAAATSVIYAGQCIQFIALSQPSPRRYLVVSYKNVRKRGEIRAGPALKFQPCYA